MSGIRSSWVRPSHYHTQTPVTTSIDRHRRKTSQFISDLPLPAAPQPSQSLVKKKRSSSTQGNRRKVLHTEGPWFCLVLSPVESSLRASWPSSRSPVCSEPWCCAAQSIVSSIRAGQDRKKETKYSGAKKWAGAGTRERGLRASSLGPAGDGADGEQDVNPSYLGRQRRQRPSPVPTTNLTTSRLALSFPCPIKPNPT